MRTYTKVITRPDWDAKQRCEQRLQQISQASIMPMYITAPDGYLSVMAIAANGSEQSITQADNFHELLDQLTAIWVYTEVLKMK